MSASTRLCPTRCSSASRGPNAGYSQGLRILVVDDPGTIGASAFSQRRRSHGDVVCWNRWDP